MRKLFATNLYEADLAEEALLGALAHSIRSLSQDDEAWVEVRNRKGRILRVSGEAGWPGANERIAAHVARHPAP